MTYTSAQQWQVFPSWPSAHPNAPALETQDTFDATGQVVKHVNHVRHDDSYTDLSGQNVVYIMSDTSSVIYSLHSTVLGGQTIAEFDGAGNKINGYVYAGGARVANQTVAANGSNSTAIESTNPVTGAAITTDANGTNVTRQEPDPLGRELSQAPDPTVAVDPLESSKWNDPMPIEATWGPSQGYLAANAAWDATMSEQTWQYQHGYFDKGGYFDIKNQFINAIANKNFDAAAQILTKNPNFFIELNGKMTAGQDAADAFNTALAKLPGNPVGLAQEQRGKGDTGEYKRKLSAREWKKLEAVFEGAREALANTDCTNWITDSIKRFHPNPTQDLNRLIAIQHFFFGGDPKSYATTYPNEAGRIDDVWIGLRRSFFGQGFFDKVATILHELRHASSLGAIAHPETFHWDLSAMNSWRQQGGVIETQAEFDAGVEKNCIEPLRRAAKQR